MTDDAFAKAVEQQDAAIAAMLDGDPGPFIDSWAASDDVPLFGAWGPIEKGHKPVTDTMRGVGSRFTGADAVDVEHMVIASSGDLAYTVGFERSHVSVEGGPPRDMVIRVTYIYRRIDGNWTDILLKLLRRSGIPFWPAKTRAKNPGHSSYSGQTAATDDQRMRFVNNCGGLRRCGLYVSSRAVID